MSRSLLRTTFYPTLSPTAPAASAVQLPIAYPALHPHRSLHTVAATSQHLQLPLKRKPSHSPIVSPVDSSNVADCLPALSLPSSISRSSSFNTLSSYPVLSKSSDNSYHHEHSNSHNDSKADFSSDSHHDEHQYNRRQRADSNTTRSRIDDMRHGRVVVALEDNSNRSGVESTVSAAAADATAASNTSSISTIIDSIPFKSFITSIHSHIISLADLQSIQFVLQPLRHLQSYHSLPVDVSNYKQQQQAVEDNATLQQLHGQILYFRRGIYSHIGIGEYDPTTQSVHVIHRWSEREEKEGRANKSNAKVVRTPLERVILNSPVSVIHVKSTSENPLLYGLQRYSADETVQRAKSQIGAVGYHAVTSNCGHFASWAAYGEAKCFQSQDIGIAGGAAIGFSGGLVRGAASSYALQRLFGRFGGSVVGGAVGGIGGAALGAVAGRALGKLFDTYSENANSKLVVPLAMHRSASENDLSRTTLVQQLDNAIDIPIHERT